MKVTSRYVVVGVTTVAVVTGAVFFGRATVHASRSSALLSPTTTAAAAVTSTTTRVHISTDTGPIVTLPTSEPQIPSSGPTLATCVASVTGWYFPAGVTWSGAPNLPGWVSAPMVAMVQNLADACENQGVLSQAMQVVAGTSIPNSDVVQVRHEACMNYFVYSAPLCING